MARFYGKVGFAVGNEVRKPGDIVPKIEERVYKGDVVNYTRRNEPGENVNDDVRMTTQISVVADPFACRNAFAIVYVEYCGTLWKVTSVEPKRPRLILHLGGVYKRANKATTRIP